MEAHALTPDGAAAMIGRTERIGRIHLIFGTARSRVLTRMALKSDPSVQTFVRGQVSALSPSPGPWLLAQGHARGSRRGVCAMGAAFLAGVRA